MQDGKYQIFCEFVGNEKKKLKENGRHYLKKVHR